MPCRLISTKLRHRLHWNGSDDLLGCASWLLGRVGTDDTRVARLVVFDSVGRSSRSEIVPIARGAAGRERPEGVLFDDDLPAAGYPVCGQVITDVENAVSGTRHLFRDHACQESAMGPAPTCEDSPLGASATGGACWVNTFVRGLAADVPLASGELATAYLDLFVRITGAEDVFWAGVSLIRDRPEPAPDPRMPRFGSPSFALEPLAVPADGQWHRLQVPLLHMRLDFADPGLGESNCDPYYVGAFPEGIGGFRFGGSSDHGAQISVDSVSIRWF